jgi:signal transduction histidine kinase
VSRSLAFAVAVAALSAAFAASIQGMAAGVGVFAILAPLAAVTAAAAHRLAAKRSGGLRLRFALIAAVVVAQTAVAVVLFVELMFVSSHDAALTILVAAYTAALGVWAGRLVGARALSDLDRVRETLGAVGAGRRDVTTGVTGSDELASLAGDVDAMIARLDAEERARRALIAAVSHDLRTPLTSLRLLTDAIDDGIVDDPREYAARLGIHVRQLSALIDDLFELSRLESGDLRWSVERVNLDELVTETVDAMRPQADARAVSVHAELDPQLAAARANPEQIQRVLFNLIQNAIRHTPADGSVVVRTVGGADAVEVEVADTGEGISPADRERVFEPFVQGAGREARADGSAGLGLAIARAIVQAHGGEIWLEDARPGTRVRFRLPAAA